MGEGDAKKSYQEVPNKRGKQAPIRKRKKDSTVRHGDDRNTEPVPQEETNAGGMARKASVVGSVFHYTQCVFGLGAYISVRHFWDTSGCQIFPL